MREMAPDVLGDLAAQVLALVVHRDDGTRHADRVRQVVADQVHCLEQLADPFQRVILRLHRDQHLVRGYEPIHGEQAERRRQVDQNVIIAVPHAVHELAQKIFALRDIHQLHERARKVRRRRHVVEVIDDARLDDLLRGHLVQDPVIDAPLARHLIVPERRTRVRLRIEVDQEHALARGGKVRAQIYGSGGLPNTPFGITYRYDACHKITRGYISLKLFATQNPLHLSLFRNPKSPPQNSRTSRDIVF